MRVMFIAAMGLACFGFAAAAQAQNPDPNYYYKLSTQFRGTGMPLDVFNGGADLAFPLLDGSTTRAGNPYVHFRFSAGL